MSEKIKAEPGSMDQEMDYNDVDAFLYGDAVEPDVDVDALAAMTEEELAALDPDTLDRIVAILDSVPAPAPAVGDPLPASEVAPGAQPVSLRVRVRKIAPEKRLVFGWLSVSTDRKGDLVIDHEGHTIDPGDLEEAVYSFVLESRRMGELHESISGRLVESIVFTAEKLEKMGIPPGLVPLGWWVGFYVESDRAWERIKSGEYAAFSIGGSAVPG